MQPHTHPHPGDSFQRIPVLSLSRLTRSSATAMKHGAKIENLAQFPQSMLAAQFCAGKSVITVKCTCGFPAIPQANVCSPERDFLVDTSWIKIWGQDSSLPTFVGVRVSGSTWKWVPTLGHGTLAPSMPLRPKYLCFVTILMVRLHQENRRGSGHAFFFF